ncbi:peptidase M61 [Ideonella sp.]|uniref:M61 family metallopeptidase n=1 Tax=Ideonella sp. TaxID=1929293 RepID=UPI002B45B614|nr:peptidase M61 [Ideonella sp.]HJV67846.1 peptidase M61 [Ideonella sp.]
MPSSTRRAVLATVFGLVASVAGIAAPAPPDAWPGVIGLAVDATDLDRRIVRVQQTLPLAAPGAQRLALRYARYLPGGHGPYGDVTRLAGLTIRAGDTRLAWQRDAADPFSFLVDVPAEAAQLSIDFQYLAPVRGSGERISITRQMLGIEWETVLLYPAGPAVDAIRVAPRLKLPPQWRQASALRAEGGMPTQPGTDGWVEFAPVSVETLVDSPLFAGRHVKTVPLDAPHAAKPVTLTLLADEPGALEAGTKQLDAHRALVVQADKLFGGPRHFRHYDLMLALSDEFGGLGLEHHESSENGLRPDYFKDWDLAIRGRELLAHEYAHSWNGKYRRPADLTTPDYHQPMGNSLLWAYEGLTEYWGHVLAVRAGLTTPEQARDRLANVVAEVDARSGRRWRPLQDTVIDPAIGPGPTREWDEWQRNADYYDEAELVWLDADLTLRALSGGRRSLDDFARAFFGGPTRTRADGSVAPRPYTEDELYAALNALQPNDWRRFFRERLDRVGAPTPGLAASGWRLAWADEESRFQANERGWEGESGTERPQNLAYSLGLRLIGDGTITQVFWSSPVFDAGLTKGMVVVAVNDHAYKPERLEAAVRANRDGSAPIRLLVKDGELYRSVAIDWRGGLRYPRLERVPGAPDRLGALQSPR